MGTRTVVPHQGWQSWQDGDGDSSIKLGGVVRSFKKLPLGTHQRLLGSFRQYLAPLKISKTLPLYGE